MIPRAAVRAAAPRSVVRQNLSRRLLSTAPPAHRPRTIKSSAARWALAAGGVWYFSTHDVLAESRIVPRDPLEAEKEEALPTVDSVAAARRERQAQAPQPATAVEAASGNASGDVSQLEEEAEGEGAFNPETGEINWDCPCLGGMANGPCGEEFRAAFSCFVYSDGEPKGIECVPKFKGMQDCFRAHPDVYGAELTDEPTDEELEENAEAAQKQAQEQSAATAASAPYSGATLEDKVPGANLTSTPSASPNSLSGSTGIPSSAHDVPKEKATGKKAASATVAN